MADFEIKDNAEFSSTCRKLETTDKAHASLFNRLYQFLFDNDNYLKAKKIDLEGGDTAKAKVSEFDVSKESFPVPAAGETHKVIMGKVKKFFEDLRNTATGACFIGNIVNNCTSTMANMPLSAAQGKVLMDLYTQLNSNFKNYYGLFGGIIIPAETDLKSSTYLTPGNYYCPSTITARTLINCPVNDAFVLKVDMAAGTNYPRQTFTKYNDGLIVSRTYEPDSQSWLSDVTYARESDLSNYVKIVDLSNSVSLNANAGGIVSIPITAPSGYKYVGIIDSFAEGYAIVTINKYFEDNSVKVNVRNLNQETVTNIIHAKILCAKS